ncbi:DUF6979 family protein [[Enterobacter] lignolyticus]|uniref:Uncharacterized protein n=1 Tax=Enterobacter lignolyticus (strain SCF1) TaxID=701347 RepID=E3G2T2_ENTLS|nr:hypothetical protein [[Enterobacter] lignolyticus]ADO48113.1 hypothetical protein Entcl_1857 [[Enterobacter] lignolyticus SCF1]
MNNYAKTALKAHSLIVQECMDPPEAWNQAVVTVTNSKTSQKKGCPRNTFLGLAYAGYLKDVYADPSAKHEGVLRRRALDAADAVLARPTISKQELSSQLEYVDKQGAYDIVFALNEHGVLKKP